MTPEQRIVRLMAQQGKEVTIGEIRRWLKTVLFADRYGSGIKDLTPEEVDDQLEAGDHVYTVLLHLNFDRKA